MRSYFSAIFSILFFAGIFLCQGCHRVPQKAEETPALKKEMPASVASKATGEAEKPAFLVRKLKGEKEFEARIQKLIKGKVDLNQQIQGKTYLIWAVQLDYVDAVRTLLDAGADVHLVDKQSGLTPLAYAIKGYLFIPKLQKPAADAPASEKERYEGLLARKDSIERSAKIFNLLLTHGAKVNVTAPTTETPLHMAVRRGREKLVRELIANNADLNAQAGDEKRTPLLYAAYYGEWEILKVLIDAGADVNTKQADGTTALQLAQQRAFPKNEGKWGIYYPFINYDKTITLLKSNGAF